jgi:hypothetical protein
MVTLTDHLQSIEAPGAHFLHQYFQGQIRPLPGEQGDWSRHGVFLSIVCNWDGSNSLLENGVAAPAKMTRAAIFVKLGSGMCGNWV